MNLAERQQQFLEALQKHFGTMRPSKLFGVSNSAKIVEGGIQIGVANLNNARNDAEAFIFACVMKFPPEDEVYFGVLVRNDKAKILERLAEMKRLGAQARSADAPALFAGQSDEDSEEADTTIRYSARNNLIPIYIARDGKIWLRNAGFWNSLNIDMSRFGPSAEPDEIAVALYPPTPSARRSLLAREFIGWLGTLVGREKIHELVVWSDAAAVSAEMQRMPASIPIAEIETAVKNAGGHYPHDEVRRYHASLNFLSHKHFVILSGLSGTGKTQLALRYARAVHGLVDPESKDPFLTVCAVRPEWTDPTGLTGYYDVLSNRYIVPPFLEAVLLALAHPTSPVFVVLDEMNLARVEFYLSDVVSALETADIGGTLHLHSNSVPLEGSTGTTIPAELPLPQNLYITGTINVDETTNPVSDKILDRAIVIDMSKVDLEGFLAALEVRYPQLITARAACEKPLVSTHKLMTNYGLGFGYRVAEEVVRYHAFAAKHLGAQADATTDDLMVQKILVKLRGAEKQRQLLTDLSQTLSGMQRSQEFIANLVSDLDEFGSFQASR